MSQRVRAYSRRNPWIARKRGGSGSKSRREKVQSRRRGTVTRKRATTKRTTTIIPKRAPTKRRTTKIIRRRVVKRGTMVKRKSTQKAPPRRSRRIAKKQSRFSARLKYKHFLDVDRLYAELNSKYEEHLEEMIRAYKTLGERKVEINTELQALTLMETRINVDIEDMKVRMAGESLGVESEDLGPPVLVLIAFSLDLRVRTRMKIAAVSAELKRITAILDEATNIEEDYNHFQL